MQLLSDYTVAESGAMAKGFNAKMLFRRIKNLLSILVRVMSFALIFFYYTPTICLGYNLINESYMIKMIIGV